MSATILRTDSSRDHNRGVGRRVSSPVFVGRRSELESIAGALGAAADGHGTFLLIAGEAGVGKTRLVDEAVRAARAGGYLAAVGGCVEIGVSGVPFAPIRTALRDLAAPGEDDGPPNAVLLPGLDSTATLVERHVARRKSDPRRQPGQSRGRTRAAIGASSGEGPRRRSRSSGRSAPRPGAPASTSKRSITRSLPRRPPTRSVSLSVNARSSRCWRMAGAIARSPRRCSSPRERPERTSQRPRQARSPRSHGGGRGRPSPRDGRASEAHRGMWSGSDGGSGYAEPVATAPPTADPLAPFSPAVRAWFEATFEAPTQAQAEGWAAIASGHHTLIHAPTGSGKTLAAFLWCLDRLAGPPATARRRGRAGPRPRPLHLAAQGADLRRRAQPPGAARRDRARGRPPRRARPRHHGREPRPATRPPEERREHRPPPAGHPHHDARVALPAAHEPGPRGPRAASST